MQEVCRKLGTDICKIRTSLSNDLILWPVISRKFLSWVACHIPPDITEASLV